MYCSQSTEFGKKVSIIEVIPCIKRKNNFVFDSKGSHDYFIISLSAIVKWYLALNNGYGPATSEGSLRGTLLYVLVSSTESFANCATILF